MDDRITTLEMKLTEAEREIADLSAVVADQAERLARAEKRIDMLLEAARAGVDEGGVIMGDQPPPHY
jgi:uncharacterized coiled-coil protein SlyX